jgi:hypothetical protein
VVPERLREIAADPKIHYTTFSRIDKKGKVRIFHNPSDELKGIQSGISRILAPFALAPIAHGGVRGRSPSTNAKRHIGQPYVVTVDVRDFFPSIRHYIVYRMFRHELGLGRDVASILTRLTTLDSRLPQGAPTSTAIANLLLQSAVDEPLSTVAEQHQLRLTRFVDDFAISGENPAALINLVAKLLSRRRLRIWRIRKKLKIMPRSRPQMVTGLNVNANGSPSVPRRKRDAIKATIHQLAELDAKSRVRTEASIRGQIAYVRQFNPGSADRLERLLTQTSSSRRC